jgi:kynurenine formamidase
MPLFPGTPSVKIERYNSINGRSKVNSSKLTINTHTGTHVDLPLHFLNGGLAGFDTLDREMIFEPAYFVSVPKEEDGAIRPEDLDLEKIDDAEALFLRTGFFRSRSSESYSLRNPYLLPEAARSIRKTMRRLHILGMDTISIASNLHPEEGKESHLDLLKGRKPILILEDVDLSNPSLLRGKWRVALYPFVIDDIEATPVSLIAQPID